MYQVLIADDEPSVIESLRGSIDWEGLGLSLAACVASGREALSLLEKDDPRGQGKIDIAILDIRMPGLSGLELCAEIRRKRENLQIIIVSGYAEFSYAEQAIRYGVLGYCLKPLEYDKLRRLLVKACANLDKLAVHRTTADLLEAVEERDTGELAAILSEQGIDPEGFHLAVCVGKEREEAAAAKPSVKPDAGSKLFFTYGRDQVGCLSPEPLSPAWLRDWMKERNGRGIGYKATPLTAGGLVDALDDCTVYAYQYFMDGEKRICAGVDEQQAAKYLEQIASYREKNKWDNIYATLGVIAERYQACFTVRSAVKLCNEIYSGNLFREEGVDRYVYSIRQLVSSYMSFQALLEELKEDIRKAMTSGDQQDAFSNSSFMRLMEYIQQNFRGEISLGSAATVLHMNPGYVSQYFKKETGITFVHYVTQLRMEEAMRLLTTTQKSAVDISLEVGFNDYFYFLKTFKKMTGKTPGQYRENGGE